jgi:hypothetical protein
VDNRSVRNSDKPDDEKQAPAADSQEDLRFGEKAGRALTFDDIAALAKKLGVKGESGDSVRWIREDRDAS